MHSSPVRSTEITPALVTSLTTGDNTYTGIRIAPSYSGLHKTIRNPHSLSGWMIQNNKVKPWRWNGTVEHQDWLYLTFSDHPQKLHPLVDAFHGEVHNTLRVIDEFLYALASLADTERFEPDALYLTSAFYDDAGTFYFLHPDITQLTQQNYEQLCPSSKTDQTGPVTRKELVPTVAYYLQAQVLSQYNIEAEPKSHLHQYVPELSDRVAQYLFAHVNRKTAHTPVNEDIHHMAEEIAEWRNIELFENLHIEASQTRQKKAYETEKKLRKKEKRREFRRKYGSTMLLAAAALVIVAFFASPFIKRSFEPDITEGMKPTEVINLFYESHNTLDHEVMAECTTSSIGNSHINQVTTLFVISRIRQGVEMKDVFTPAPEWLEAGRPELKDASFVFGVTEIEISSTAKEQVYRASYIKWSTLPPKAEELTSEEEQARVSSTGKVRAFRITEIVAMTETSSGWKIGSIEEQNKEPYEFRTKTQ